MSCHRIICFANSCNSRFQKQNENHETYHHKHKKYWFLKTFTFAKFGFVVCRLDWQNIWFCKTSVAKLQFQQHCLMFFQKTIEHVARSCEHFARSCKKKHVTHVQQVPEISFDWFLVLCFAKADLQNYMFRQALRSETDFPTGLEPYGLERERERERMFN